VEGFVKMSLKYAKKIMNCTILAMAMLCNGALAQNSSDPLVYGKNISKSMCNRLDNLSIVGTRQLADALKISTMEVRLVRTDWSDKGPCYAIIASSRGRYLCNVGSINQNTIVALGIERGFELSCTILQ
jgi:hypothetical protein